MEKNLFESAGEAILLPEVQDALRILSKHNLGVCVPHIHSESGPVRSLPQGMVQLETDLQIAFVDESDVMNDSAVPVAWRWNQGTEIVARCSNTTRDCYL